MRKARAAVVLLAFGMWAAGVIGAQEHAPSAGRASATQGAHHEFLQQERAAIERGEGFGMALAADRAGYPGSKHILELKEQLKLTAEQQAAVEKLFAEMKAKAIARGKEFLAAEEQLEKFFAEGKPEAELREESYRVATLRAELRWVHLAAHLEAKKLLTAEQLMTYRHLRWVGGGHTHSAP